MLSIFPTTFLTLLIGKYFFLQQSEYLYETVQHFLNQRITFF